MSVTHEIREIELNMGPQHPSTHGVLRVLLKLDGETVVEAHPDVGYLHRCFEKISEQLSYPQIIPYTDRNDYLGPITNEWAYCLAVERLAGIEVPERAEYIRVIAGELTRIVSHVLWFGTYAMDAGAVTPFLYAFREREHGYDLLEQLTGSRMNNNYLRLGGVRNDLPAGWLDRLLAYLDDVEKRLDEYDRLFTRNPIFEVRTQGLAPLAAADAIALGITGPMLRASGVAHDLRRDEPYSVYDRFEFAVPVGRSGDCFDRYMVRMREIGESIKIIRQAVQGLPEGPFQAKLRPGLKPPPGEVYAKLEAPRGEVGCYIVSDGSVKPWRLHWRAPSFIHLQALPFQGPGLLVADMVMLIGSLDIILGEVDR